MQIDLTCSTGSVSFVERDGVRLMVASAVILREIVFTPSSPGRSIYVPKDLIAREAAKWNGVPVLVGHDMDPRGKAAHVIGFTENPRVSSDGSAIVVDFVINADRFPDIVDAVMHGADVSVGAKAKFRNESGVFQGRKFEVIATSLEPDHVALLINERGACSREDGCGVPMAACDGECRCKVVAVLNKARRPAFSGTSTRPWSRPGLSDYLSAFEKKTGKKVDGRDVSELPAEVRKWIADRTLLGDPNADNFRDLSFFPVVEPDTGDLNRNALVAVLSGRGAQAGLDNATLESARSMARKLLEEEFKMEANETINAETIEKGVIERIVRGVVRAVMGKEDKMDDVKDKDKDDVKAEGDAKPDVKADDEKAAKPDDEPVKAEGEKAESNDGDIAAVVAELAKAVKALGEKIEASDKDVKTALEAIKAQRKREREALAAKVRLLGIDDDAIEAMSDDVLAKLAATVGDIGKAGLVVANDGKVQKDEYLEAVEAVEAAFFGDVEDGEAVEDKK